MSDFTGFTFKTGNTTYTSEELGIIRVSDGDRYKDSLVPEIEDKTVEIPGLDGTYFYGSNFKTRTISLSIAFDKVTEKQLRDMRQIFGYKHTGELIFNEWPYKKYLVKVVSPPELEYVCFDEQEREILPESATGVRVVDRKTVSVDVPYEKTITVKEGIIEVVPFSERPTTITVEYDGRELSVDAPEEEREVFYDAETGELGIYIDGIDDRTELTVTVKFTLPGTEIQITRETIKPYGDYTGEIQRIYKGEGTIEFIAYYPFAKQVAKKKKAYYKSQAQDYEPTQEELAQINEWWGTSGLLDSYDGIDVYSDGAINVYNPGDVETGFRLVIPFSTTTVNEVTTYSLPSFTIKYVHVSDNIEEILATLNVQEIIRDNDDVSTAIQINTMNGLIEGVYKDTNTSILPEDINGSLITSGTIFNEYVTGEFFKLLPCEENEYKIKITGLNNEIPVIYYDYLYF